MFTSASIRTSVHAESERLFAPWRIGRPEGWTVDTPTKDMVCLAYWMREQLEAMANISDEDRRTQEAVFHRYSRSDKDLFELAAQILNDAETGNIVRDRKPS